MARKRMFSLSVVDTDQFLEMPPSSQSLYFHLGMRADDDGFIANPNRIIAYVGSTKDDMKILIAKEFVIPMGESGVFIISHWKVNNTLRGDRHKASPYAAMLNDLTEMSDNSYRLKDSALVDNKTTEKLPKKNEIIEITTDVEVIED